MGRLPKKYIGRSGRCFANLRKRGIWVLKICVSSIRPCSLNKCKGWSMISTPYFTRCLKQSISHKGPFLKLLHLPAPLLGKAF